MMNRDIFQYHNGTRDVHADPLVLRDTLIDVSMGELENLYTKVRAIDAAKDDFLIVKQGIEAKKHLIHIAREVFGMTAFDDTTGKGALAEDCLTVLNSFLGFLNQKKTRQRSTLTTSPPTESTSQPQTSPTTATTSV